MADVQNQFHIEKLDDTAREPIINGINDRITKKEYRNKVDELNATIAALTARITALEP